MPRLLVLACLLSLLPVAQAQERAWPPPMSRAARKRPPGLLGPVGPRQGRPRKTIDKRLRITRDGSVHEDLLVDLGFADQDAVQIRADKVVFRRCEVRNSRRDGIEVYGDDVLIESCRIHHLLNGTFADQKDAHGITGRANRLVIRNCEIYLVSGDCVQFDPDRKPWSDVLIENCLLWTGPLPADAAGFKKGEQPGENAVDTKQKKGNPRSRMHIRNCVIYGWKKGGQISNMAGLNLKDHVDVTVERCVFYDNEICLRLRGPTERGGAQVTTRSCWFYRSDVAVRWEDDLRGSALLDCYFGPGLGRKTLAVSKGKGKGTEVRGKGKAIALDWFRRRMRPRARR